MINIKNVNEVDKMTYNTKKIDKTVIQKQICELLDATKKLSK